MSRTSLIALCSAQPVPDSDGVPEWVHLLPAGEIRTNDGRGPYKVASMSAIADRLKDGVKLPIDECHSTDRAAPLGQPAPARGWIVALQARDDGLWGQVEWTGRGRELMEDRAYAGISPVIQHLKDGTVIGVLRASLINTPNIVGLASLHSEENGMDFKAKLIELLGLDSDADDAAVLAALSAKTETSQHSAQNGEVIVALQSELADITGKYNELADTVGRDKATAFVDTAIAEGRVGVKPLRDKYITMHMADPAGTAELVGALPKLTGATITGDVAPETDDKGLDAGDRAVMSLMGVSEEDYTAAQARQGIKKEAL